MRNITFFSFILFVLNCNLFAQEDYQLEFNSFSRHFEELDTSQAQVIVSDPLAWGKFDLLGTFPIGFDFQWQDSMYSEAEILTPGVIRLRGSVYCSNEPNARHEIGLFAEIVDPGWWYVNLDGKPDTTIAPVRYITKGTPGDRQFVVEFKNTSTLAYQGDILNYQIIFYEKESVIEYHFGSLTIDFQSWGRLHLAQNTEPHFTFTFDIDCDNPWDNSQVAFLTQSGDSPVLKVVDYKDIEPFSYDFLLHSPPTPGTVWQFKLRNITSVEDIQKTDNKLRVYPNPSSGDFTLETDYTIENINVIDLSTGRNIPFVKTNSNQLRLNTPGLFMIMVTTPQGVMRKKVAVVK